jgi:hypothetical protein
MTTSRGDDSGFASHSAVRELEKITSRTDTRDVLAHASRSARKLNDYFIVDIDAHVTETAFWSEVTDRIDNDYLRHAAVSFRERGGSPPGLLNVQPGMLYQTCSAASRTGSRRTRSSAKARIARSSW